MKCLFFSFKVFCLYFFYYLYFFLLNVLNQEAGKGIRRTLNSLKTGLGAKYQFNLRQRKRVVAEDGHIVVPKNGSQTEL